MSKNYRPEKIHKIIFKISGEIIGGKRGTVIDIDAVNNLVDELISVIYLGYSLGVVLGGGNIFRGASETGKLLNRFTADNVGMLATIQNALIMRDILMKKNYMAEIFSAIQIDKIAKFYTPNRAETSLNEGSVCFFCAGTGNPFFTTDTAAVLRAIELNADIVLKGTKVKGVYSADPMKDDKAEFIRNISFDELLIKKLTVMDMTAFSLARDYNMPIKIFNITKKGNMKEAILNSRIGTYVHP